MVAPISVLLLLCLLASQVVMAADEGIFLGEQRLQAIRLAAEPTKTTQFAAEELQRYLEEISRTELPILATEKPRENVIVLDVAGRDGPTSALGEEGFSIRTAESHVVLTGACPRAALYAVYAFLERLGCRWCFPADAGEVVPRRSPLVVPALDVMEKPSFSYRCFQHCAAVDESTIDWIDWMAKNRMNRFMVTLYPAKGYKGQWYREFKAVPGLLDAIRTRGIQIEAGHHSLYYWLPPKDHFDEHPEWYSMIAGKRPRVALEGPRTQLCFSSPAMADAVAERVVAFARDNPEADVISIYTNDGLGYCECPACQDAGSSTDAYVQFVNRVAEAVHRHAPGKKLSMLSYNAIKDAPRSKVFSQNTLCAIATWPPPKVDRLKGWLNSGVGQVVLYEYYMGSYSDRSLPGCWTTKIADELRTIHQLGLAGVATQCELANWGSYALNYWVCARMLWDVSQRVDDVVNDYLTHYYGPAAPAMKQYFAALEGQGRMRRDVSVPEAHVKSLEAALGDAEAQVGDDAQLAARVGRDRLSCRYLRLAWEIEERERDAVSALQRADRESAVSALSQTRDAADACVQLLVRHRADRVFLAGRKDVPHEVVGHFYTTRYYQSKKAKIEKELASVRTRPLTPNLALEKPAVASSEYSSSSKAPRAVDGRRNTMWASGYSPSWPAARNHPLPLWLRVDLGDVRQVGAVVLRTPKQLYHYYVELSADGEEWRQVAEKSDDTKGSLDPGLTHIFDPQPARYVRVTVTENPKNAGHIYELEVYEEASAEMNEATREQELEQARQEIAQAFYGHMRTRLAQLPESRITETWPASADEWLAHVPTLRERLETIFHFPSERCNLEAKRLDEIQLSDVVIEKVVYQAEPQSLVTANVYRPAKPRASRLPALILPSGHGGSKSSPYNQYLAQLYAKAGCVVLAFDPIGEEERDEKGRMGVRGHRIEHRIDRCMVMGHSTIGKMVFDAVRGIDYLVSRPDVDPERIACAGHSLGGTLTEYVTAVDERVRVSMPTAWTCNFADIIGELSCCWRPLGLLHVANDPELFAVAAPRCAVLVLAGGNDACPMHVDKLKQSTLPPAQRVFGLFGGADSMQVHVTPRAGHQPFQTNRAALLWMEQHLGLPNWSSQDIEGFPELTDIKAVCTRLAGSTALPEKDIQRLVLAHAVDCGVELLPPEQLRCLSPERWADDDVGLKAWIDRLEAKQPAFTPPATVAQWEQARHGIIDDVRAGLHLPEREAEVTNAAQPRELKNGRIQDLTFGALGLTSALATPDDVAPPWPCIVYLDASRTTQGASERIQAWLAQGQAVLALDCVPFDDTAVLLGTSSAAYNVAHVIEAVDVLAGRSDIDMARLQCVSAVDDVGLLAAVLDARIKELTVESASGTRCSFQSYRLNGIVPGLRAVATRSHLMAALAPRRLTVCTREERSVAGKAGEVYRLLGASEALVIQAK